jgi:hypothetical protein
MVSLLFSILFGMELYAFISKCIKKEMNNGLLFPMGEKELFLGLILEKNPKQNNKRGNYSSQIRVKVSRSGGGIDSFLFLSNKQQFFYRNDDTCL